MKIRKLPCLLLCAVMACCALAPAACAEMEMQLWADSFPSALFQFPAYLVVGQDNLWRVDPANDAVLHIQGSNNYAEALMMPVEESTITFGAAAEDAGVYFAISDDGQCLRKMKLADHTHLASIDAPEGCALERVWTVGDQVIALGNGQLWRTSVEAFESMQPFALEGIHQGVVQAVAVYRDNLAVMFQDGMLSVWRYDGSEFQLDREHAFDTPLTALFLNRDYSLYGLVYGVQEGSRDVWNYLMDGRVMKSESLQWPAEIDQLWSVSDGIYARAADSTLWIYQKSDARAFHTDDVYDHSLVVMSDNITGLSPAALELFNDAYPQTQVASYRLDNELGNAASVQAEAYDLLCLASGTYSLSNLVQSGAILPLDGEAGVQAALGELIDLSGLCAVDGRPYMIPTGFTVYVWEAHPALFETMRLELPQAGWTFEDFFALGQAVADYNAANGTRFALLNDQMETGLPYLLKLALINHMEQTEDVVDEEAFAVLTERYLALRDLGVIRESTTLDHMDDPASLFQTYAPSVYNELAGRTLVLPPVEDDQARYLLDVDGLALSSRVAYPEEAAFFMVCFLAPENLKDLQSYRLGPVLRDLEAWRTSDSRFVMTPTPEVEEVWRRMLQNGISNNLGVDVEYTLRYELYKPLCDGDIDTATFVAQLHRMLRMMLRE